MKEVLVRRRYVDGAFAPLPASLKPKETGPVDPSSPLGQKLLRGGRQSFEEMALEERVTTRKLKRQKWWTTDDVDEMRRVALPHQCPTCESGRIQMVMFLEHNPGLAVAWGQLDIEELIVGTRVGTVGELHANGRLLTGDVVPEVIQVGEFCSMCHHSLDGHELWIADLTRPLTGEMVCPECDCDSVWSEDPPEKLVVCRPSELNLDDELDRLASEYTFVYAGSVEDKCAGCDRGIWIGPRGQAEVAAGATAYCYACGLTRAHESGEGQFFIGNLGNPEAVPPWVKPAPDE